LAVVTIAHKPELTKEEAKAIFARHFQDRYQIEDCKWPLVGRDFMLVKNAFVGVGIGLQQSPKETKFAYGGLSPRTWARLLSPLFILLFWNGPTSEVTEFIKSAPEFK